MDTTKLRATADSLLRKHGSKIDKGLASAERFAKKRVKGDPKKARQIDKAASAVRGAVANAGRPRGR